MDRTDLSPNDLTRWPSVDSLARDPQLADLPSRAVIRNVREHLAALRAKFGPTPPGTRHGLLADLRARIETDLAMHHRRVVNATGIVLHTGLGRAVLPTAAIEAIVAAAGSAIVEVDPIGGERNQRESAVRALLTELTGAASALVVNNNAAAVNLTLRALAAGREVIVSRGEQVEIGGGFRMPDVMREAGCRMVEVGATNRTHPSDYERAMGPDTAMLLKVHTSNFRVVGFTSSVGVAELVALGREKGALVFDDLGSGLLLPREQVPDALSAEPLVRDSLVAGVDVVCFSGDKLLGGPQCGILLGRADLIQKIRAHALYRAFRCDKLTLAALEACLRIYRDGDPLAEVPALRAIAASPAQLRERAEAVALRIPGARVRPSESFVGSGANPARPMPSSAVVLEGGAELAARLRHLRPLPVFARVADDLVWLDLRTLLDEDPSELVELACRALGVTPIVLHR
ncbi:MAG: L-seryl-tRNA(Sec) selenium transferase [Planctomycetota bacterium]